MENNSRKPLFYFSNRWFLLFLFVCFPIFSQSPISLRSVDLSSYPEVKLRIHTNGDVIPTRYSISEQVGSTTRLTEEVKVSRLQTKNPLGLYLSIPSYTNAEDRRWLLQLANQMVKIAEQSGGQSRLHIQSDASFPIFERIRSQALDVSFPFPKEDPTQFPIRNWDRFVDSIPENESNTDSILVLVSFAKEWPDRFAIPEFAKKIREKRLQLFVLSPNSLEANKLVSYANGSFFSISKADSFTSLFLQLKETASPDWEIQYLSPWKLSQWKENEVNVTLSGIPSGIQTEFQYEITPFQTMYLKGSDPFVFFPVSLFLILLCIASLYYLRGFEPTPQKERNVAQLTPVSYEDRDERKEEMAVYDRMYGETLEKAAKDREIALVTKENAVLHGSAYTYAVIQVREGSQLYEPIPLQWEEMTIGSFESNHIVLHDPNVSGLHAKIKNRKGKYILFDCVSEAGVYLNGRKLLRPKVLHNLDEVQIGKTILTFRGRY